MKKDVLINKPKYGTPDSEMPELTEKDFYRSKPNRFVKGLVQLDEDLSDTFKTSKDVNDALRLVLQLNRIVSH